MELGLVNKPGVVDWVDFYFELCDGPDEAMRKVFNGLILFQIREN